MSAIDEELVYYNALAVLVRRARDQALAKPFEDRTAELGFPALGKARDDRLSALASHFDRLEKMLADTFLLRLVAAFESTVFAKLATAIGGARTTLDEHYPSELPFSRAAAKLLRADFQRLSEIEELVASYPIGAGELKELREHRNWVAHGGRLGRQSMFSDPDEVHRALTDLLRSIVGETPEIDTGEGRDME